MGVAGQCTHPGLQEHYGRDEEAGHPGIQVPWRRHGAHPLGEGAGLCPPSEGSAQPISVPPATGVYPKVRSELEALEDMEKDKKVLEKKKEKEKEKAAEAQDITFKTTLGQWRALAAGPILYLFFPPPYSSPHPPHISTPSPHSLPHPPTPPHPPSLLCVLNGHSHPLAKNVHRTLFQIKPPQKNEFFQPGRMVCLKYWSLFSLLICVFPVSDDRLMCLSWMTNTRRVIFQPH